MVEKISEKSGLAICQSANALNGIIDSISEKLKTGDVCLMWGGTFAVAERKGRQRRNPRTGEVVEIKPRRVPVFRAGSILKREVIQGNQG
ncbi:HU family DNA-binding protein [Enterocloster sp. 210928-DFI.2.20]|nr:MULTISPECIES: HU family DNA-binding protein [Enterocloster]MCB7096272.1 HU family DNA-binding protein [Enterocloster sp. 210928-DFI.2.20]MDU1139475.1 HU family DNA-binding protein [Enterocloster bolteae]